MTFSAKIRILTSIWLQTQICSQNRFLSPLARVMTCFWSTNECKTQGNWWLQRAKKRPKLNFSAKVPILTRTWPWSQILAQKDFWAPLPELWPLFDRAGSANPRQCCRLCSNPARSCHLPGHLPRAHELSEGLLLAEAPRARWKRQGWMRRVGGTCFWAVSKQ